MVWCEVMWWDVVRLGVMWCDVVRCYVMWCDVVRCGGGESPQLGSFPRPFSEPGLLHAMFLWNHMPPLFWYLRPPWLNVKIDHIQTSWRPTAGTQINSLMAVQLLGEKEKDESIKLSSFVAAFESKDSQAHRCSRGMSTCQLLTAGTAGSRSCVSGAQGCYCCSWPYLDQHRHHRQEELRKAHRLQWSGAVFRGGLPPVGRRFQW